MQNNKIELLGEVASYYSEKLMQYGETPQGVDWNGEEGQILRFEQLCKIIATPEPFSLNDIGCGYGALLDFLEKKYQAFSYVGIDVSEKMIQAAKQRYQSHKAAKFRCPRCNLSESFRH